MDELEFAQLNVIPLVDVMLVLLTIVLTTSTFAAQSRVPVDLPKAAHGLGGGPRSTVIELDKAGALRMNGTALSLVDLTRRLEPMEHTTPVLIRSDRGIRLQSFIDLLDLLKGLGFTKVSVQTQG